MKQEHLPLWWHRVIKDIKRACESSRRSFLTPNVIIGFTESDGSKRTGYLIRVSDGEVGYFPISLIGKKQLPVGAKIKSKLPQPEFLVKDPQREIFIFETIREQVKLLPKVWLKKVIKMILAGENHKINSTYREFSAWVLLSKKHKNNTYAIAAILKAIEFEGLKGLARYNDLYDID